MSETYFTVQQSAFQKLTEISSAPQKHKNTEGKMEWLVAGCQVELSLEDHGHRGREIQPKSFVVINLIHNPNFTHL